jgi:PAS domain S-box-containing protein
MVAIASLLTWLMQPFLAPTLFALFYPAIMLSALYGGRGPGTVATVLAGLITIYLFLQPTPNNALQLLVLISVALMITELSSRYRQAKHQVGMMATELRESQGLFEDFMKNSPVKAFIKDEAGRYLYVNSLAERLFERQLADWIGKTDFDLYPHDLAEQLHSNDAEVLRTKRILEVIETEASADGDRQFMSFKFPLQHRAGRTLLVGMSLDITSYKRAEAALRTSEARFQLMAETIQDVFWITDFREPRILYVSPAYERIWGRSRDELYQNYRHWAETIHPEDREKTLSISATCQHQDCVIQEYRIVRPDGSIRWIRDRGFAVRDEGGEIYQVVGVAEDITERKQSEAVLQQGEDHLRLALSAASMVAWEWRLNDNSVTVSDSIADIFGLLPNTKIETQQQAIDLLHPDDVESYWTVVREAIMTQSSYVSQFRIIRPVDGTVIWVEDRGSFVFDQVNRVAMVRGVIMDITERHLSEIAIRQTEAKFRRLVEANIFGVAIGDFVGNINYANDALLQIIGYSREELEAGQVRWIDLTPPEFLELDRQAGEELRQRGVCKSFEKEYIHKDGHRVPVLLGAALLDKPYDQQRQIIAFYLDLTERKQAEAALRLSEDRYRTLANALPQLVWVNEPNGNVQFFNERWLEYTGAAILTLGVGLWVELIHPDDFDPILAKRTLSIQAGEAYEVECRLRRFDSQYRWHLARVVPIKNEQGQVQSWVGTATDIHDLKQVEAEQRFLSQSSSILAAFLDYQVTFANVAQLLVPDLADFCFFHVIATDGTIQQVTCHCRHPDQQAWFDHINQFVSTSDITCLLAAEAIATGQSQRVAEVTDDWLQTVATNPEYLQLLSDIHISSIIVVPLKVRHRVLGAITLALSSESGRRYTEADLALIEELTVRASMALDNAQLYHLAQESNRIKDEFLAVLSHELRSPLNPILGWVKLLQTRQFDQHATQRALETIERNAKLQTQLIEDLLDISRILRGKMMLNVTAVNLITVIQAAIETVRLSAEAKGLELKIMPTPISPVQVSGDAVRLQQIIWNLLSNAIKFTPAGGQVKICLEQVTDEGVREWRSRGVEEPVSLHALTSPSPPYAQITISDTGKGIKPEFLPHVFEYFRQEDSRTTRQFGGLGLGLAIVRYLTELHGGTVRAESQGEGQGASFIVRLPLFQPINAAELHLRDTPRTPATPANAPLLGLRILVVDDEPDMRELMWVILQQAGAEVRLATSAADALTQFDAFQPTIVISDIGMPTTDGYTLIQQIRLRSPQQGGQVPAIALTAYAGEVNQQQALAAGFQKHIAKPVEPTEIIETILAVI